MFSCVNQQVLGCGWGCQTSHRNVFLMSLHPQKSVELVVLTKEGQEGGKRRLFEKKKKKEFEHLLQ